MKSLCLRDYEVRGLLDGTVSLIVRPCKLPDSIGDGYGPASGAMVYTKVVPVTPALTEPH